MTVTSLLDLSITIVPWLFSGIYAPGDTGQFQPLRRFWLGRAMGGEG